MPSATAYKIFTPPQWAEFERSGTFAGAPIDLADGYNHLSTANQLAGTLALHFAGQDVHVAEIALAPYGDAVRWEASRGGALFPHIYAAALTLDTVVSSKARSSVR